MRDVLPFIPCPECFKHAPQVILGTTKRQCENCGSVYSTKAKKRPKKEVWVKRG